ncbi:MAG: SusD/RagB family nutrient-binding outer membrane lipoprotein [Bacteroidales bacterium]
MKKILILAVTSLMAVTSCSEDVMDRLNKDTNNPGVDVVPARFSITDAITSTAFTTISGNYAWNVSSFTEQEFGTGNNQLMQVELRNTSQVAAATTYDNEWNGTYGNIANLRNIIKKTSEGGLNAGQTDILGMAQTLFALNIALLTDLHGDIPCSEAGLGAACLAPKLDKQETIYQEYVLGMLDNALVNLKAAGAANNAGAQDLLFSGKASKWIGFAYALKARYLLHTQFRNPSVLTDVIKAANDAISAGFEGADLSIFDGVNTDNPWTAFFWSRQYTGSSNTVIKLMNERMDNRVAVYDYDMFGKETPGEPGNSVQAKLVRELNAPSWLDNGACSVHLLSKSELYFILAEAKMRLGQDASADFRKAVEFSFLDYENSDSAPEVTNFVNNGAEYAAGLTVTLEEIMIQKYLSQCRDEQIEAYNDIRRCRALGETWIKLSNPLNNQNGVNYWPERLPYGNSSVISNPTISQAFVDIDIYKDKIWLFGGSK